MLTIVTYDISDNTSRNYLIKKLRSYGLKRLQKSVFSGYLELNDRLDLANEMDKFISSDNDSIVIFPVCESCKSSILTEGQVNIPEIELTYRFL